MINSSLLGVITHQRRRIFRIKFDANIAAHFFQSRFLGLPHAQRNVGTHVLFLNLLFTKKEENMISSATAAAAAIFLPQSCHLSLTHV
jgi:hypothetical protein